MRLKSVLLGSLACVSAFYIAGCEGISTQDPTKIFSDGKWPEILRKLNSQLLELRNRDQIVQRVQDDQKRTDLMRVAVMDCGVDYTNPDLVNAIAFDINDGKITGTGYDVMGKDNTPSPQILEPSLFAFGAADVVDGKIVSAPANPLDILLKINQDFEKTLKAKIMADPDLASSFYAKLTNGSLNVIGAYDLLVNNNFDDMVKSQNDFLNAKTADVPAPLSPSSTPSIDPKETDFRKISTGQDRLITWLTMTKLPWALDLDKGVPAGIDNILNIEHYDKFATVLQATFKEVDQRQQLTQKYETFKKFITAWSSGDSRINDTIVRKLSNALAFKQYGPAIKDPVRTLNLDLRNQIVSDIVRSGTSQDWSSFTFNNQNVSAALDNIITSYQKDLLDMQAQSNLAFDTKISIKTELEGLPQLKSLKDWYIKNRGWEQTNLADENNKSLKSSLYRKLLYRTAHPFIDENSATTSHGTHVSGIISKQDPNIRIYPVRVLTQGVNLTEIEKLKIANDFINNFSEWIQDPLVFKAVSDLMKPIGDMVGDSTLMSKDPKQFSAAVVNILNDTIRNSVVQEPTNYLFVGDVIEAVKKIGEQKIKIANVSLGSEFEAPVVNPNEANPQQVLENAYKLLQFEYFKYQLGTAITKFAPNTVFVVANGNSGKWVDGRSQSALPVDLSSPFLEKYENKKKGLIAPNNQIKNVIGVGSLATDGKLSSYTNLIISKRTPFVMAEGESVLSPVRMTDLSPINGITQSYLPKMFRIGRVRQDLPNDTDMNKMIANINKYRSFSQKQMILTSLVRAVSTEMAVEYSDHRALMSGTSMASPTVAGLIAHDLLAQAKAKGVNADALYDHPDFTAEKVIATTLSRAKKMKGDLYIPLRALTGEIRPDHTDQVKGFIHDLDLLKNGDASGFNKSTTTAPMAPAAPSCNSVLLNAG
ncbi:MAG: S8 family serine peptidase [Pseudobdellovibrionaceae bacterium]